MSEIQDKNWGSNVQPKNFGKGAGLPKDWECGTCHSVNKGNVRYTRGSQEICQSCGYERDFSSRA